MGTSKQERKYKTKQKVSPQNNLRFRVLVNSRYYLEGSYDSWESADTAGAKYTQGKRISYVVVTGV